VDLRILAMRRIRIGRVPLAGLQPGQWRYLAPHERF
jgi:23S rRNA pseudouridine2604 synthase